jgi:hypothetical protein
MWEETFREIEQMIGFVSFFVDLMQDGKPILMIVILEGLAAVLPSEAETGAIYYLILPCSLQYPRLPRHLRKLPRYHNPFSLSLPRPLSANLSIGSKMKVDSHGRNDTMHC